jgi:hypothetical protein
LGYCYRKHLIPMRNVHEIVFQNNAILPFINSPDCGLGSRIIKSNHCCPVKLSAIGLKPLSLVVNEPQLRIGALAQRNNQVFSQMFQYVFKLLNLYRTVIIVIN